MAERAEKAKKDNTCLRVIEIETKSLISKTSEKDNQEKREKKNSKEKKTIAT